MGTNKWNKVIKFLDTTTAKPEKVLNSLKAVYGKNKNSMYQDLRSSWPIDVVYNIYHKTGTTNKTKKIPLTQVISNRIKTTDYKTAYRTFHPGVGNSQWDLPGQEKMMKMKMYKTLTHKQHVKNCNDVWNSKSGKGFRKELENNNGQYPFTNYISKEESDALGPVSSSKLDPKRTYKKEKDHGTDISFENESAIKK